MAKEERRTQGKKDRIRRVKKQNKKSKKEIDMQNIILKRLMKSIV